MNAERVMCNGHRIRRWKPNCLITLIVRIPRPHFNQTIKKILFIVSSRVPVHCALPYMYVNVSFVVSCAIGISIQYCKNYNITTLFCSMFMFSCILLTWNHAEWVRCSYFFLFFFLNLNRWLGPGSIRIKHVVWHCQSQYQYQYQYHVVSSNYLNKRNTNNVGNFVSFISFILWFCLRSWCASEENNIITPQRYCKLTNKY